MLSGRQLCRNVSIVESLTSQDEFISCDSETFRASNCQDIFRTSDKLQPSVFFPIFLVEFGDATGTRQHRQPARNRGSPLSPLLLLLLVRSENLTRFQGNRSVGMQIISDLGLMSQKGIDIKISQNSNTKASLDS